MYTKISDYVTCYNPYCIAIHIAYDNGIDVELKKKLKPIKDINKDCKMAETR